MDVEPPPDEDYFAYWCVDVKKNGAPAWGMKLQMRDTTCMRVMAVTEEDGSPIHEWNKRCLRVFPSDQVKVDDQIFRVNGETDPTCFQAILLEAQRVLMSVRRPWWCHRSGRAKRGLVGNEEDDCK